MKFLEGGSERRECAEYGLTLGFQPSGFSPGRYEHVGALLNENTIQARQMLRKILTGKIELEPVGRARDRAYKFRGALTIGRLISGISNTPDCGGPNGKRPWLDLYCEGRGGRRGVGGLGRIRRHVLGRQPATRARAPGTLGRTS